MNARNELPRQGHSKSRRGAVRGALVLGFAALLAGGAAWQLPAAAPRLKEPTGAAATHLVPGSDRRDSYADVVKAVAPSVVTIHTEGKAAAAPTQFQAPDDEFFRRFFGERGAPGRPENPMQAPRAFKQRGLGSGVIVDADGYVLTNHHVIDRADEVRVETTDGRMHAAKVVGADPASDLALLKIPASGLQPIAMGDSNAVQVGDVVLAVGNPLGVGQTVTMGIISAKGRSTRAGGKMSYEDFLQTDAPINHGNSGGALVNVKGELVGINSQILSESGGNIGIGFAIPSAMAKHVMDELRAHGKVTRAQLGVSVQGVTSEMAESLGLEHAKGVIIGAVVAGSAAERAGLERGDVIEALNGQPIHDTNSLRNRVADLAPGAAAEVSILRDDDHKRVPMKVTVKLDEARAEAVATADEAARGEEMRGLGVDVTPLTRDLAGQLGLAKDAEGLVIEEVSSDGRAAEAGLEPGDVIQEVGQEPVRTIDDLRAAVKRSDDKPLLLLVNRKGDSFFLTVRPRLG